MTDTLPYTADGLDLGTAAQWIGTKSNPWAVPGAKGENVSVPARHGSLWVADKSFDEASLTLQIHVAGARDNGTVPADQLDETRANIDRLLRIFTKRKKLIHLGSVRADGTQIETWAECLGAFDLTRVSSAMPYARFSVGLNIPGAFWQDVTPVTWSSPTGLTPNQALRLEPFEGGTAPMDDAVYLVHGPASDPELRVIETGAYVRLGGGGLAAGETWRVDAAGWTSVVGPTADVTFTSIGHTNARGRTFHGGSASFVDLPPLDRFELGIEFGGTNLGTSTQVEARGRRKYLIS